MMRYLLASPHAGHLAQFPRSRLLPFFDFNGTWRQSSPIEKRRGCERKPAPCSTALWPPF